jgi:hypothetical protein
MPTIKNPKYWSTGQKKFWKKVRDCKHKDFSAYFETYGWCDNCSDLIRERRCSSCKVYFVSCDCGASDAVSGETKSATDKKYKFMRNDYK